MEMLRNAVRFKCGIRDLHREEGGHSVLLQRGGPGQARLPRRRGTNQVQCEVQGGERGRQF